MDNSLTARELSIEEMTRILVIKNESERARSLIKNGREQALQAQVGRLASYAQLGIWPTYLEVPKSAWQSWARNRFVKCWRMERDSNLVMTEEGRLGIIQKMPFAKVTQALGIMAGLGVAGGIGLGIQRLFNVDLSRPPTALGMVGFMILLLLIGFCVPVSLAAGSRLGKVMTKRVVSIKEIGFQDLDPDMQGALCVAESYIQQELAAREAEIAAAKALEVEDQQVLIANNQIKDLALV